jgi:hypothetical protein
VSIRISLLLIVLASAAAASAQPGAGAALGGAASGGRGARGLGPVLGPGGNGPGSQAARNDRDWLDALAFFREHAPVRAAAFDKMTDEQQRDLRPIIMARYQAYRAVSPETPEIRQSLIRQTELEDGIFSLKTRLGDVPEDSPEHSQLEADLHRAVVDLVEAQLEERRLRLARLQRLVTAEQMSLAASESRKADTIEQRYQAILRANRADAGSPDQPRRGSGRGGPRP